MISHVLEMRNRDRGTLSTRHMYRIYGRAGKASCAPTSRATTEDCPSSFIFFLLPDKGQLKIEWIPLIGYFPFPQSLQEGWLNALIFFSFYKVFLEKAGDISLPGCDTRLLWNMLVSQPAIETAPKTNRNFTQNFPLQNSCSGESEGSVEKTLYIEKVTGSWL